MPQFSPGEIILNGKYRIEKLLGEGAFGEVYLAMHLNLKAPRALKVLRKEGDSGVGSTIYGNARRRFLQESKLGAQLGNHPRIVQVMDFDEVEDLMVLALEYAPGGSLQKRLENLREEGKPMPVADALRIAIEVAEGLSLLHKMDVVHRDLKPGNILFDKEGHAKVADFGLAQMPHGESRRSTFSQPEPHPGTPGYMSPEQKAPPYDVLTPASDIYALGAVLFEMLTGRSQYTQRPGTRPSDLRPGIPPELDELVLLMLAQDPQERPWDGAEIARLLQVFKRAFEDTDRELGAKPAPQLIRKALSPASEVPQAGTLKAILRWGWLFGLPLLLFLLYFAVRGITLLSSSIPEPTRASVALPIAAPTNKTTTAPVVAPTMISTTEPTAAPKADASVPPACTEIGQTWVSPVDGMVLVCVPAGKFSMGSNDGEYDEKPVHVVYLDAYWMDQTEVVNAQYKQCVKAGGCTAPEDTSSHTRSSYYSNSSYNDYPVIYVDWNRAAAYCAWVGRELPTEAQWEKAARGTDGRSYPWGNAFDGTRLNFADKNASFTWSDHSVDDGYADTAPVGSYMEGASPYGVLDMAGNVWEWAVDWYGRYPFGEQSNPVGPGTGDFRVVRGGSWNDRSRDVRSANRWDSAEIRLNDQGFRCALSLP